MEIERKRFIVTGRPIVGRVKGFQEIKEPSPEEFEGLIMSKSRSTGEKMPKQTESTKEYFKVLAIDERMMAVMLAGLPKKDRFECLRSLAVKVALKKHAGNKEQTAKYLGVSSRSMRNWANVRKS